MATVITQQDIQNHVPFILKWSKNPGDDGAYNPGWKQQMESDRFLELIENRPSIMNDAVFHKMDALEEDISYMQVEVDLHSMDALSGDDKGAQIDDITTLPETVPAFSRSKLRARGMTAFTYTPKTFLLANIEKQSFLNHIEGILAERAGYSAEVISIYGKRKTTGATSNGLDHIDGFFAQLEAIKAAYDKLENPDTTVPMGYMPDVDPSKPLVPQFKLMITQFTKQKGNRSLAKIYVSATTEANLILEADERPTEKGDNLYFDNGQLTLWGVPIVHADVLDNPRNNYGEQVLMANPDSLIYGFLEEITSENDYILKKKAYLSTVDVFFDVLLLYNKDALAMKIPSE